MIASTTALPATTATTTVTEQLREGSSVNAASRDARVGAAYRGLPDRISIVSARTGMSPSDLPVLVFA